VKKLLTLVLILIQITALQAGPPFNTDDPEPVGYRHWEFYLSSINTMMHKRSDGTLPHFETNYGILPDVQVHLLLPLNYSYQSPDNITYGYSNTEVGVKYRFLHETAKRPQIGIFPIVEVPTFKNNSFDNQFRLFLPIWIQKTYKKFSTYGGIGYWINFDKNTRNQLFAGWQAQYNFSKYISLGGELFYNSPNKSGDDGIVAVNIGGFLNFSEKLHFIYSAGHTFNSNTYLAYMGLLCTI
jgi:hypothetical protein